MLEQPQQIVILPGGWVTSLPVIPENQTATWTRILLAASDELMEAQKPAKEQ